MEKLVKPPQKPVITKWRWRVDDMSRPSGPASVA
jgi:hypothetical protein